MTTFKITITADTYPMEYIVSGRSWATAIHRAVMQWKESKGKGSRTQTLSIRAVKGLGELVVLNNK